MKYKGEGGREGEGGNTGDFLEQGSGDFPEDPGDDEGEAEEAAVGEPRRPLGDPAGHRRAQAARRRRAARRQARHRSLARSLSRSLEKDFWTGKTGGWQVRGGTSDEFYLLVRLAWRLAK